MTENIDERCRRKLTSWNVNNVASVIDKLVRLSRDPGTGVSLSKNGEEFYRAVNFENRTDLSRACPTSDGYLYSRRHGIPGELIGFFCGDPDEWIPVLIRDGMLDTGVDQGMAIMTLVFPAGTPYIKSSRKVEMPAKIDEEKLSGKEKEIMDVFKKHKMKIPAIENLVEIFVVYDRPLKPSSIRILSDDEISDFDDKAKEISLMDEECIDEVEFDEDG